jgi:hypothetical protein
MVNSVIKRLLELSRLGIKTEDEENLSRGIIFSNIVFLCLPIVYIIFMLIDYEAYLKPLYQLKFDQFIVPIIILECFLGLWLNKYGLTILSRVSFLILWPILLHLIPIYQLNTPSDYYLAYPFGIVFHAILIQLMLSHNRERWLFTGFMLINLSGLLTFPSVLVFFDLNKDFPPGFINKYYYFVGILYWLLFNLVTFYTLYVIKISIKQINDSKAVIEKQKEELRLLNQSLEEKVMQRTSELAQQNEKLKLHAHYNAHLLRGPFCRVQGLFQIQELVFNPEEVLEIKTKMKQSLQELDTRIREIQVLVETEEEYFE